MRGWSALLIALAMAYAAACRGRASGDGSGPLLEARWSGKDSAKIKGTATAEWCDSLRLLEIQALVGDTGVAIALYPVRRIETGRFRVVAPATVDSNRPWAAVALRWFAETSIRGFQGDSGVVVLEQPRPGVLTGTFDAKAHSVTDAVRLTIRGDFRDLPVRPVSRGCPVRRKGSDSGTGVH